MAYNCPPGSLCYQIKQLSKKNQKTTALALKLAKCITPVYNPILCNAVIQCLSGSTFTGNTSATCINELWVSNISGCTPINIGTEAIFNQSVTINNDTTIVGNINLNLPAYSGDTVAGVGGLVIGDLWQTTASHTLGVAGIVMTKQ